VAEFSKEIGPAFKGKRLGENTKSDIRKLIDGISKRGAPVGANRALAATKTWLAFCVERDIIAVSPAATIRPPAPERPRERVLSDQELASVWHAAGSLGEWLLALTGQRRSKVAGP
jgi:integrase